MLDKKVEPIDCNQLKVTFRVKNEIEHLNGRFSVYHEGKRVGSTTQNTQTLNQYKMITVHLDSRFISPCNSYNSLEIRSGFKDNREPRKDHTHWEAKAFDDCCPHLTSMTTTTTTTTTSTTTLEEDEDNNKTIVLMSVIIASLVLLIILITSVLVIVLIKKKRNEELRRGEAVKTEQNNLYGIYADGPVYNTVTDQNDYYSL